MTKLYTKYIGDWGGTATVYRFDAIKNGKVIKSVTKEPVNGIRLQAEADHTNLTEHHSYDVALVRIRAVDAHGNVLPFIRSRYGSPRKVTLPSSDLTPLPYRAAWVALM